MLRRLTRGRLHTKSVKKEGKQIIYTPGQPLWPSKSPRLHVQFNIYFWATSLCLSMSFPTPHPSHFSNRKKRVRGWAQVAGGQPDLPTSGEGGSRGGWEDCGKELELVRGQWARGEKVSFCLEHLPPECSGMWKWSSQLQSREVKFLSIDSGGRGIAYWS